MSKKASLLARAKRRALGLVLYNHLFRPKKAFDALEDYFASGESLPGESFQEIHPAYAQDDAYQKHMGHILSPFVEKTIYKKGHRVVIARLREARLDSDGGASIAVVSKSGALLGDVTFSFVSPHDGSPSYHGLPGENNIYRRPYLTAPRKLKGVVFSLLTGGGGNTYAHWFIDALSRLDILERSGWKNDVDYFIVPNNAYSFQKETLDLLGIPPEKVINGLDHIHLQPDELIITSHPRTTTCYMSPWIVEFIRKTFGDCDRLLPADDTLEYHPLIYISRRDAVIRQVINEKELEAMLHAHGFRSYEMADLTLPQKVKLMKQAKVIVTPTGSGITNLVWCNPGTHLIELMTPSFITPFFFELLRDTGVVLDYIIGSANLQSPVLNRHQGAEDNISIDPEALRAKIQLVLEKVTH